MNWVTIKAHPALRFYEYKLFSRKKLMCQVKFVPIYIETPDLTEVLVGLLTCLKKKTRSQQGQGLDGSVEKVICSSVSWGRNVEAPGIPQPPHWPSLIKVWCWLWGLWSIISWSLRILSVGCRLSVEAFRGGEGSKSLQNSIILDMQLRGGHMMGK